MGAGKKGWLVKLEGKITVLNVDVVIIGSGPAGCAAAISCRMQGLDVLMVAGRKGSARDTGNEPAESVHPGIVPLLTQLNAAHCIDNASQGSYVGIEVNNDRTPLGEDEHGAWKGHHINRAKFDAAFLQTAQQQGVLVIEENVTGITVKDDRVSGVTSSGGKTINCLYVVDGSGCKQVATKCLGFKKEFYSPPLLVWTGVSNNIPVGSPLFTDNYSRFIAHDTGWTWLAPQSPGYCTWTRMELKGRQQLLPPVELSAFPVTGKIKASNRRWVLIRPICGEGILLCGDAAGIIDPAAGQGILNAIVSASMAVNTIKACLKNPSMEALHLAGYDDWFCNNYRQKIDRLQGFYQQHGIDLGLK